MNAKEVFGIRLNSLKPAPKDDPVRLYFNCPNTKRTKDLKLYKVGDIYVDFQQRRVWPEDALIDADPILQAWLSYKEGRYYFHGSGSMQWNSSYAESVGNIYFVSVEMPGRNNKFYRAYTSFKDKEDYMKQCKHPHRYELIPPDTLARVALDFDPTLSAVNQVNQLNVEIHKLEKIAFKLLGVSTPVHRLTATRIEGEGLIYASVHDIWETVLVRGYNTTMKSLLHMLWHISRQYKYVKIDDGIFKSWQQYRAPYASKGGKPNSTLVPIDQDTDIRKMLVTGLTQQEINESTVIEEKAILNVLETEFGCKGPCSSCPLGLTRSKQRATPRIQTEIKDLGKTEQIIQKLYKNKFGVDVSRIQVKKHGQFTIRNDGNPCPEGDKHKTEQIGGKVFEDGGIIVYCMKHTCKKKCHYIGNLNGSTALAQDRRLSIPKSLGYMLQVITAVCHIPNTIDSEQVQGISPVW